jgi:hypothetical protein
MGRGAEGTHRAVERPRARCAADAARYHEPTTLMEWPLDTVRERIERAAEGLVYSRSARRPFEFHRFTGITIPVTQLSAVELASLAGARGAEVRELTLDAFLAPHTEPIDLHDPESRTRAAQFQALRDALRESLEDVRVVRHHGLEVRCFVLGNDPDTGEIAGVGTVA